MLNLWLIRGNNFKKIENKKTTTMDTSWWMNYDVMEKTTPTYELSFILKSGFFSWKIEVRLKITPCIYWLSKERRGKKLNGKYEEGELGYNFEECPTCTNFVKLWTSPSIRCKNFCYVILYLMGSFRVMKAIENLCYKLL